jgi:hypothetical protein
MESEPRIGATDCGDAGDFVRLDAEAAGRPDESLMSLHHSDEADRVETTAAYEGHRRRFVASGGGSGGFDTLHLLAAARLSARRVAGVFGTVKGEGTRIATEQEIRTTMSGMANDAIEALARGRFRAFRRMLWPFGTPLDD